MQLFPIGKIGNVIEQEGFEFYRSGICRKVGANPYDGYVCTAPKSALTAIVGIFLTETETSDMRIIRGRLIASRPSRLQSDTQKIAGLPRGYQGGPRRLRLRDRA